MHDTNLHYKDCSEMHSGSCSPMTLSYRCPVGDTGHARCLRDTWFSSKRAGDKCQVSVAWLSLNPLIPKYLDLNSPNLC